MSLEAEFLGYFPLPAGSCSTTPVVAVDLSRELGRTSGTYRAWDGALPASEPCACGGVIKADSGAWHHVRAAMQAHQRTKGHVVWRKREGL